MPRHGIFGPPQEQGGVLGPAPREEEPEEKRGFMDVLAEIFTGAPDPRLSDEQRERVRRDALIQAGLATISAGGSGLDRVNLVQALAEGAQAGRATGAAGRRGAVIGGLAGGDPDTALPQFRQMFVEALQAGDAEGARSLATVINAMEAQAGKAAGQDPIIYRVVGDEIIGIDRTSGEEVSRIKGGASVGSRSKPAVVFDPASGANVLAIWRPDVGAYFDLQGNMIEGAAPQMSVSEKQDDKAGQIMSLQVGLDYLTAHGRPTPGDVLPTIVGVGTEWKAQTEPMVLILTRLYQGGRPTDKDIELSRDVFIPNLLDTNAAVEAKMGAIQRALDAFNAGRRAPAFGPLREGVDPTTITADGESATPIFDEFGRN